MHHLDDRWVRRGGRALTRQRIGHSAPWSIHFLMRSSCAGCSGPAGGICAPDCVPLMRRKRTLSRYHRERCVRHSRQPDWAARPCGGRGAARAFAATPVAFHAVVAKNRFECRV
jgi:hypothetical protein